MWPSCSRFTRSAFWRRSCAAEKSNSSGSSHCLTCDAIVIRGRDLRRNRRHLISTREAPLDCRPPPLPSSLLTSPPTPSTSAPHRTDTAWCATDRVDLTSGQQSSRAYWRPAEAKRPVRFADYVDSWRGSVMTAALPGRRVCELHLSLTRRLCMLWFGAINDDDDDGIIDSSFHLFTVRPILLYLYLTFIAVYGLHLTTCY